MEKLVATGLRAGTLYTIRQRAFDPRWSSRDIQRFYAWCATAQHLGWGDARAIQTAEAIVMRQKLEGIVWPAESGLDDDMEELMEAGSQIGQ
jgi:hypothetical protein